MSKRQLLTCSFVVLVIGAVGCGGSSNERPRTVSAKLQTLFTKDDGTTTLVNGWDQNELNTYTVTGLLVPDSSAAGYTSFPVTVAADGSFSVANVPAGPYFIQVDHQVKTVHSATVARILYRTSTSNPDLTLTVHGRADRTLGAGKVQLNVTGLTPLADPATMKFPSSQLRLTIAQASISNLAVQSLLVPKPQPGDTAVNSSFNYGSGFFGYLPDASKGDVTYFYERNHSELGSGATTATYQSTANYLRSASLTLANGGTATISGAMTAAPQSGSIHANLKMSQFAALAGAVHPGGTPSATFPETLTVFALQHAAPVLELLRSQDAAPLALLEITPQLATDVDYGTLTYGRLPESNWTEYVQLTYNYDFPLPTLAGVSPGAGQETYVKTALISSAPTVFAPALSPPASPRLGAADAFQAQTGVGLTPTVSWGAPATGTPASYTLSFFFFDGPLTDGVLTDVTVVGLTETSFKVPPGMLTQGFTYVGAINATTVPSNPAGAPLFQTPIGGDSVGITFGPFQP
jgi:hypothetical protein